MAFPTNETEAAAQGYKFANSGKCRSCSAHIDWYETPKGKMIPLDEGGFVPHWSTCPDADDFRDKSPKAGAFSSKTDGYRGAK